MTMTRRLRALSRSFGPVSRGLARLPQRRRSGLQVGSQREREYRRVGIELVLQPSGWCTCTCTCTCMCSVHTPPPHASAPPPSPGEHTHDVDARNGARDWGEAQLCASCDWAVHLPFYRAGIYLWLNFHTIHHLFPRLDFSHHPAAQRILLDTCQVSYQRRV